MKRKLVQLPRQLKFSLLVVSSDLSVNDLEKAFDIVHHLSQPAISTTGVLGRVQYVHAAKGGSKAAEKIKPRKLLTLNGTGRVTASLSGASYTAE
jgi:hypothetical protein